MVVAVEHLGRGEVGMTDLPEKIELAAASRRLLESKDVQGDVVARADPTVPIRKEMHPSRMPGTLERPLQGTCKVIVTPAVDDLPAGNADPEAIACRGCPRCEGIADRSGATNVRMFG